MTRLALHSGFRNKTDIPFTLIEETMVKKHLFNNGNKPQTSEIESALDTQLIHLAIPKQSYRDKYLARLKKAMKLARKTGEVLRMVLGIFIDEDCTPGGLYNTEDCALFDAEQHPWVRSFTLAEGPTVLYEFDRFGRLSPAVEAFQSKKLLLVDLDSRFDSLKTLPQPGVMTLSGLGAVRESVQMKEKDLVIGHEVLVSLPEGDPRKTVLVQEYGGAVYRVVGKREILVVPFSDKDEAVSLVNQIAQKPDEVFCMPKVSLFDRNTLTLTCASKSKVTSDELYTLLKATAVIPIGHDRYRFTTNMPMLAVAKVLYRQNQYVKGDKKKFRVLRSDSDRFVILTNSMPRQLARYYRRTCDPVAEVEKGRSFWYKVSNVPRGYSDRALLESLECFDWWPKALVRTLIDRRDYYPTMWVATEVDVDLPNLFLLGGRPCVLLLDDRPPPGFFFT